MGHRLRRALLNVALFTMVLRALLPAGWMPGPASDGAISFVICSADGLHHLDGRDRRPDSGDAHQHDVCPFAAAPHVATPTTVAQIAPPLDAALGEFSFAAAAAIPDVAAYLKQAPRAPPISA